jgi:hypothetical protein
MRPIDGDILLEQFRTLRDNWDTNNATHRAVRGAFVDCILRTQEASTIEAAPVKHGRWIFHREEIFEPNQSECYMSRPLPTECSVCGFAEMRASRFTFCPNCGAKMDLKDGENNA